MYLWLQKCHYICFSLQRKTTEEMRDSKGYETTFKKPDIAEYQNKRGREVDAVLKRQLREVGHKHSKKEREEIEKLIAMIMVGYISFKLADRISSHLHKFFSKEF